MISATTMISPMSSPTRIRTTRMNSPTRIRPTTIISLTKMISPTSVSTTEGHKQADVNATTMITSSIFDTASFHDDGRKLDHVVSTTSRINKPHNTDMVETMNSLLITTIFLIYFLKIFSHWKIKCLGKPNYVFLSH